MKLGIPFEKKKEEKAGRRQVTLLGGEKALMHVTQ
jgi:hypothetical protein